MLLAMPHAAEVDFSDILAVDRTDFEQPQDKLEVCQTERVESSELQNAITSGLAKQNLLGWTGMSPVAVVDLLGRIEGSGGCFNSLESLSLLEPLESGFARLLRSRRLAHLLHDAIPVIVVFVVFETNPLESLDEREVFDV